MASVTNERDRGRLDALVAMMQWAIEHDDYEAQAKLVKLAEVWDLGSIREAAHG